ncbi:fusaric acid resistance family protein [Ancylobacter aquaticus]|uniref:Fusaric acid resistance family protein n=1 Tax=Ancylobacter aquaticus TaxID=100 RepID=A0A4R1IAL2_ANCAQ|nr:FUSC family protein [Ancylobacter aquaticus]TCK31035.1 fusaric acid resistance family protein [Ancylobacter aquaticus]
MAEAARPEGMSDVDRQAFATATGVLAAVYIALSMGLDEPYWAALSVLMIANTDRDALVTKGVLRVLSTLVGVGVGFVVAQWMEGLPIQQALLVGASAAIGTYGKQRSAYSYAWFYGGLTFMLVMLFSMVQPQDLYSFAHYRCYEIIIGVVCGTLASWALGPNAGELHARLKAQAVASTPENALRQALIAGLGAIVIVIVWSQFDLPQLPQVLISSLIVVDTDPNATRHKGWQRILGCIAGGAAGLLVIGLDATDQLWWAAMLFLGIFSFARVHLSKMPNAYIGTQSAIAYIVTLIYPGPPSSLLPPLDRLVGIVIGVSIMTALVWALNPPPTAEKPAEKSA